jgi:hypothetical protein
VHSNKNSADEIIITARIGSTPISMLLDTGAKVSVLNAATCNSLGSPRLKKSMTVLQTYSGQRLQVKGYFITSVTVRGHTDTVDFLVVDVNNTNIFGRDMLLKFPLDWTNICRQLKLPVYQQSAPEVNLITVDDAAREFPDLFSDKLGCVNDVEVHVELRPDAKLSFYNARKIPLALESKVDAVLEKWEADGVIQSIERSEWAAPIVVVPKPDREVRVCADFSCTINPFIVTDSYPSQIQMKFLQKWKAQNTNRKLMLVTHTCISS